ncbi:hypothetical protein SprV_0602224300 [Sparganum proliferum]
MSSLRWLILLQTFTLLAALDFANEKGIRFYNLCKKEHENCSFVAYRLADETKGNGCRVACGRQRGELNWNKAVYFCEERNQTCKPYVVYGREGYAENFERHVMCVQTCHFVGRAEHSTHDDFEMCSSEMEPCNKIKKINGSFDTFNKCAFQCDGWPKLENSVAETVYFCPRKGYCEDATFFVKPGTTNGFEQLMTCFNSCMSGLVPTEFTATALNSSAIRVTWNKPSRSAELSGKYELIVYNSTHEDEFTLRATEDIITDLEPSTTYNLTVRAYWSNDTLVDAVAFTSVTTRPRGELNWNKAVYFCEERNQTCKPYVVYGREGYAENFERHVMCVQTCHFVGRAEHSTHDDFEMCSSEMEPCNKIKKINGSFDTFNKCAFQCDGWPKLENSVAETVYFCPRKGYCEDATFFVKPGTTNGFEQLMTCFNSCMSGLVPTEFTATALNSSAIRVTWNKPSRSAELSGKYELIVYNSTHEDEFTLRATEDIITDLEPSTTYNLTVRAYWSNDTLVDAVAFTSVTTRPREVHTVPVYKLCKKEHEECGFVPYREKDTTKGKGCREACAKQRGGLSETMTVYFCEEPNKTCTPYEVYGRAGYAENFERHFKCVSLCHLVGRVQHSVYNDFEMCSSELEPCTEIKKINGTFDAFNKCAFQCDGWPDLEKTSEDMALFCPHEGYCQDAKYFSRPDDEHGFESLMTCLKNCTSA